MPTVIYPSPVFGPIHSRRLGISLGINLMPGDGKICTFDCLYCECGFNAQHRANQTYPRRREVCETLEARLQDLQKSGIVPDVFTFAGNGEPTAHPMFPEIVNDVIALRNRYFPEAKVSVLSNATLIARPSVFEALKKVDNNILKLDTVNPDYIQVVNRPTGVYRLDKIVERMKAFKGNLIIQTMFLKGMVNGKDVNNTSPEYVQPWLQAVKEIAPQEVMIYTIDRETPQEGLKKASRQELDHILGLLREAGIRAAAAY